MTDDLSLPSPYEPLVDKSGKISEIWYRYLNKSNIVLNSISRGTTIAALPTTSDLDVGHWRVFKDSSGGSVRMTFNDNSTIVSVALTT